MNRTEKAELIIKKAVELNWDWLCDPNDYDEFTSQIDNLTEEAHDYILAHFEDKFKEVIVHDSFYSDFFHPLREQGLLKVDPAIVAPGVLRLRYNRYLTYHASGNFRVLAYVSEDGVPCDEVRSLAQFESLGRERHRRLVDLYRFSLASKVASSCHEFREMVLAHSDLLREFLCAETDIYSFVKCKKVANPHTQVALALYKSGLVYAECDVSTTEVGLRAGFCNLSVDLDVDFFTIANAYNRGYGRATEEDIQKAANYFMIELQENVICLINMLFGVSVGSGGFVGSKHTQLMAIRTKLPVCSHLWECFRQLI